jgi:hypothetical protein
MSERKDVEIKVPTANVEVVALAPGVTAVSKDKSGNLKAKRQEDGEGSYSADYDGEEVKESAEITNPKSKSEADQKNIEKKVVRRLLPVFNKGNSTNFLIINGAPEQNNIADVFIKDPNTGVRKGIQVTVSDEGAITQLRSKKSLSRRGNEYQLYSAAIKKRIEDKTGKYPEDDRRKTVLALDGWPGVNSRMLNSFRMQEKGLLEKAGYCQIWFVGTIADDIVRLY